MHSVPLQRRAPRPTLLKSMLLLAVLTAIHPMTVRANVTEQLKECRAIGDAVARLQCFDRIAIDESSPAAATAPVAPAGLSQESVPPPAPVSASAEASRAPASLGDVQKFGAESLPITRSATETRLIKAKIVGAVDGIRKGRVFDLDNGQRWRVIDDGEFEYVGRDSPVELDRNFIGTYWMRFTERGPRFKVRRIQ